MDPIPIRYTRGERAFTHKRGDAGFTLLDFWAWAYSDIHNNTTRGAVAEFIVAMALRLDKQIPRDAWSKYDLEYRSTGIEVKSASYHQRWYQAKQSGISYKIPKTLGWEAETNKQEQQARRQADIYVLSLLAEKDRAKVDPLELEQWRFWVIPTRFFDSRKRSQHSITFNSLLREVGEPLKFSQVKQAVDQIIDARHPDSESGA
jgi:hypothetical protein